MLKNRLFFLFDLSIIGLLLQRESMDFKAKDRLTEAEINSGLKSTIREGLATQAMVTFSSGIFLVAFAIQLGASNFTIGLLAAIPPLSQLVQIPSIYLVEKYRRRRPICFSVTIVNRLFLLLIALIPFLFRGKMALAVLVWALVMHAAIGSISLCSWNSWMRDLVPRGILGTFFARRLSYQTALGVILSLAAGVFIDYWGSLHYSEPVYAYSILFGLAWLFGLLGSYFISTIPEPKMISEVSGRPLSTLIFQPLKDVNFRHLIHFLFSWNFAVNLAAPFFTVYMLKRLELNMTNVIGLTVLSQVMNVISLRVWGRFSDRFSNKSVLAVSGPIFMVSILAWTFTTFPEKHSLTMPLLIAIHIIMGITVAGVTLASGNISLKLAPKGKATAYLAAASMVNSVAAGIAPIVGGRFVDFFSRRQFSWSMIWTDPQGEHVFRTLSFQSWDFFFFLAFILGIYSIHRLALVSEEGSIREGMLVHELVAFVMRPLRNFSTAGGLRNLLNQPLLIVKNHRNNNHENNRSTVNGQD
jgi:MFS family permease